MALACHNKYEAAALLFNEDRQCGKQPVPIRRISAEKQWLSVCQLLSAFGSAAGKYVAAVSGSHSL